MLDKTCYTTRTDITLEEIMALVQVRTALETGEIAKEQFNMAHSWLADNSCGSAGCIGGWVMFFMCEDKNENFSYTSLGDLMSQKKFKSLFYPTPWKMYQALPADGVRAINNFLADKPMPWAFMRKAKSA